MLSGEYSVLSTRKKKEETHCVRSSRTHFIHASISFFSCLFHTTHTPNTSNTRARTQGETHRSLIHYFIGINSNALASAIQLPLFANSYCYFAMILCALCAALPMFYYLLLHDLYPSSILCTVMVNCSNCINLSAGNSRAFFPLTAWAWLVGEVVCAN